MNEKQAKRIRRFKKWLIKGAGKNTSTIEKVARYLRRQLSTGTARSRGEVGKLIRSRGAIPIETMLRLTGEKQDGPFLPNNDAILHHPK